MFGYVLPEKSELKVKEYELFKAYYCGVCKAIGKRYGQVPRLTLNYDTTFLALLLSSVIGKSVSVRKERCIVHPINKRNIIRNSEIIDYAADMNVLLSYYKFYDNWKDNKSIISATGILAMKKSYGKIKRKYSEKCDIIKQRLDELDILQKAKCDSVDKAAEPFAKLMEEVLTYEKEDLTCEQKGLSRRRDVMTTKQDTSSENSAVINEDSTKILKWIGYNLGKWIYVLDAYDDIEKDIKERSYNPFLYQYNYNGQDVGDFKLSIKEKVEFNLFHTLSEIAKAYDLLASENKDKAVCNSECKYNGCVPEVAGIVENIIYIGLLRKTEKILTAKGRELG